MKKIIKSLKNINYKLFLSLLILGLCPTIYTTIRVYFIGQLPNEYSYSIAGQLSWVNLIYEVLSEAIILPLFFFIGQVVTNKSEFTNRIKTGLLISIIVYTILSIIIIIFIRKLLILMATDSVIIDDSITYIRIESVANIFQMVFNFILIALVALGINKYVYILTFLKLILCVIFDTLITSTLPFSLNLGINGIAITNIIVNLLLFIFASHLLKKEEIYVFKKTKMSFSWIKEFFKVGGISGLESLVRNIAYMLMVSRMVNMVGEQGTYWVANNFIWGWLLLPILQLGELIKRETAVDKTSIKKNSLGYFTVTLIICALWCITIPLYKPFMTNILGYSDVDKLFNLVILLLGFYMLYALQNVFDATFYGLGKTEYLFYESVITNSIYYGCAFILYILGVWEPTLTKIAVMFGIGNLFDSIVSFIMYMILLKKERINIFKI